jgi:molybdenum cofactor cytidylyltransferase
MGRPKAMLPLEDNQTFIMHIVRTLQEADVEDVVVVLGHGADAIAEMLQASGSTARVVINPDYESGQFSSVVAGLRAIDHPGVEAMMLTLVDVPLVAVSTVRAVRERYRATHAPIVRPVRGGEHGHPVLIDRALFDQLRGADPASGAKPVVRAHVSPAGDVSVADAGAFLDVDTPEDYLLLLKGLRAGQL